MNDKLDSSYFVESYSSFTNVSVNDKEDMVSKNDLINKIEIRGFNDQLTWSILKQTNFIESIYMGCEIPAIILFQTSTNPIKYLLVDGLNRVLTIQRFLKDELRLCTNGLQKANFLEKKTFSQLDDDAKNYFLDRGIQMLNYTYKYDETKLNEDEINAIAKQLYIRYNSGIKLKNEEIQKADYEDDYITKQIENKMTNSNYLNLLKNVYLTPKKNSKTYIEKTLMYCRLAITSCYTPLNLFCKPASMAKRIDNYYRDYTVELNKDNILNDFEETIMCLSEIINKGYINEYETLKNQEFMIITYWLLFMIKKNKLIDLSKFDWQNYIEYFGEKEKVNPIFSYYKVNLIDRYNSVIEYIKNKYKIDLLKYVPIEKEINTKVLVNNFHDLHKYNFLLPRDVLTISKFLEKIKTNSCILRPSYQRREINDLGSSSFLIESILLNLQVPDVLIYKHKNELGESIFEVVDGQQRCWSLLGYLNQRYKNLYGEEISSEKEGFSLTGLTILSDLNGKKVFSIKNKLSDNNINKILNGKIRIVYIPEDNNPYFSVRDYFTRINKTIQPIKKTSYRYWNVRYDSKLMSIANNIGNKYKEVLLPKFDNKYLPQQYVVNLAYLFYTNQSIMKGFSVQKVSNWLYGFEKDKTNCFITNKEEKIKELRINYEKALENVDLFLGKILNWLNVLGKNINDLISVKYNKSFTNLLYLYYLLHNINEADLINDAKRIYEIINEFYIDNFGKVFRREEEFEPLKICKDKLSPFFMRTAKQEQFKTKMKQFIEI